MKSLVCVHFSSYDNQIFSIYFFENPYKIFNLLWTLLQQVWKTAIDFMRLRSVWVPRTLKNMIFFFFCGRNPYLKFGILELPKCWISEIIKFSKKFRKFPKTHRYKFNKTKVGGVSKLQKFWGIPPQIHIRYVSEIFLGRPTLRGSQQRGIGFLTHRTTPSAKISFLKMQ